MLERVKNLLDGRKVQCVERTHKILFALVRLKVIYSKLLDNRELTEEEIEFVETLEGLTQETKERQANDVVNKYEMVYTVDGETGSVVDVSFRIV